MRYYPTQRLTIRHQTIARFISPTLTYFAAQLSLLSKNSMRSRRGLVVCNAFEMTTGSRLAIKLHTTSDRFLLSRQIAKLKKDTTVVSQRPCR